MEPDLNRVADFFDEYGSVDLLLAIDPADGSSVGEITEKLAPSEDIVRERLETAVELDLLELSYATGDHANTKRYYLTQLSRIVIVGIVSLRLDAKTRRYYDLESEIADLTDDLKKWVNEEELSMILDNPSVDSEEMIEQLQLPNAYPGDDLPDNFDRFISKAIEPEGRKGKIGQIEDQLDYENLLVRFSGLPQRLRYRNDGYHVGGERFFIWKSDRGTYLSASNASSSVR